MFQLDQDRHKIQDEIGKGRFGTVFPYQKHSEDLKWVVKRIKAKDADALVASLPEVVLGMSCDHPNVVPIKGYFIEKNSDNGDYNIYTKLPRMKGTLLEDFQQRKAGNIPYSEEQIIRHCYSLVCGVDYLHKKKIFHGEIKPESLLLGYDGVLKIADVGISKHISEEKVANQQIMNYQYSAPECVNVEDKKGMLKKGDTWSLGVVILELCCFELKLLNPSMTKDLLQTLLNAFLENLQLKYHAKITELLKRILSMNPEERPDVGLIKGELEKSFPEVLNIKAEVSDEQKQEILGKYEAEIKHLKEIILQFEAQKTEEKTPAKHISKGDEETKVSDFEEQIRKLQDERNKMQYEYGTLLVKEKEEKRKLKETIESLEAKLAGFQKAMEEKPKIEKLKRESQGDLYKQNLQAVISTLNGKWNKWYKGSSFECRVDNIDDSLQINVPEKSVTDESLRKFSRDLMTALEEHYLLNVNGISFYCSTPPLTDRGISDFAYMLSNENLKLKRLVIYIVYCERITDKAIEDLSKAVAVQLPHLDHLRLMFNQCPELTDKSLGHLAKVLCHPAPQLHYIELAFEKVSGMTDIGFENVAKAIEKGVSGNRRFSFLKLLFPNTQVTSQKKEQIRVRFEQVGKVGHLEIR